MSSNLPSVAGQRNVECMINLTWPFNGLRVQKSCRLENLSVLRLPSTTIPGLRPAETALETKVERFVISRLCLDITPNPSFPASYRRPLHRSRRWLPFHDARLAYRCRREGWDQCGSRLLTSLSPTTKKMKKRQHMTRSKREPKSDINM
jgi:hypothetical protein